MESNYYPLSDELQRRIKGLVGEIVALDYVASKIDAEKEPTDKIIISTNRNCNKREQSSSNSRYITIHDTPEKFLQQDLVNKFLKIGYDGIDLKNADRLAKHLFKNYMFKSKEEMLSEIDHLYSDYIKESEIKAKETANKYTDVYIKSRKESIYQSDLEFRIKEFPKEYIQIFKSLSKVELAKLLTLSELRIENERFFKSDTSKKISCLFTCFKLFDNNSRMQLVNTNAHTLKNISKYISANYEDLNIVSSIFRYIKETNTHIDSMVIHLSNEGTLKKLIIIECKTGKSPLTKPQRDFADCIKRMKFDKVEYKKINIDYQLPKQLLMSEYSLEDHV